MPKVVHRSLAVAATGDLEDWRGLTPPSGFRARASPSACATSHPRERLGFSHCLTVLPETGILLAVISSFRHPKSLFSRGYSSASAPGQSRQPYRFPNTRRPFRPFVRFCGGPPACGGPGGMAASAGQRPGFLGPPVRLRSLVGLAEIGPEPLETTRTAWNMGAAVLGRQRRPLGLLSGQSFRGSGSARAETGSEYEVKTHPTTQER